MLALKIAVLIAFGFFASLAVLAATENLSRVPETAVAATPAVLSH